MNSKTVTFVAYALQDTGSALNAQLSLATPTTTKDDFTAQTLISSSTAVSVASSSTAYTKLTYTLTLGATDASKGLALTVSFPTVGAVTAKNFVVADMQFEISPVATTFEQRPYGMELALCQRYYQAAYVGFEGYASASSSAGVAYTFSPQLRVTPTSVWVSDDRNVNTTAGSPSLLNTRVYGATIYKVATISGGTGWSSTITLSAEL
jgi:hypothetical protein